MTFDPLHSLLDWAEREPALPAVVEAERTVSYEGFADLTRRLASAFAVAGENPRVLIDLPPCAEAYAAMFATRMAGGCYAPLNHAAPEERRLRIARRFAPQVVVAGGRAGAGFGIAPVAIDIAGPMPAPMDRPRPPGPLAYVMFTSGTTGEPKGVMVPTGALDHYAAWCLGALGAGPGDRLSQHPTIAFDVSVTDIYGALCSGASLHPVASAKDRLHPGRFIRRHRLTHWNSVPSIVDLMRRAGDVTSENLASLRLATFLGEALLPEQLDALFAARPDLVVHNTYGPTEATVSVTALRLASGDYRSACRANVAIGEPIPGMGVHLLGGEHPDEGEIVLTGPQLASGYWEDTATTAASFPELEIAGRPARTYRTGDWAERRDGRIYFVSRMDRQVKVHGNRVELGEIEAGLRELGVRSVAAVFVDGAIHACVERQPGLDLMQLRRSLARLVPDYEVPRGFHWVDDMPRNANDKVDAKELARRIAEGRLG